MRKVSGIIRCAEREEAETPKREDPFTKAKAVKSENPRRREDCGTASQRRKGDCGTADDFQMSLGRFCPVRRKKNNNYMLTELQKLIIIIISLLVLLV